MDKSLNLLLQDFEDGLISYINDNPLPVKAKLLCIKSVVPEILSAMTKANAHLVEKERTAFGAIKEENTK